MLEEGTQVGLGVIAEIQLVIDIQGYFAPEGSLGLQSVTPCRLVDTRAPGAGGVTWTPVTESAGSAVLGEVRAPGPFAIEPGASLLQLLSRAGGPTERADMSKAQVVREGRA